jgi:DNA replication protein DnaC
MKIIEASDIKYCVLSSLTLEHDYYNTFIDWCSANLPAQHFKLAINSLIGSLAINKENSFFKSLFIIKDRDEAYSEFLKLKGSFIKVIETDQFRGDSKYTMKQRKELGTYYQVFDESISLNIESEKEIYNMIVDIEALELHKMKLIIEKKGGTVMEYKTDSIRYSIPEFPFKMIDEKNIKGYYWDTAKKCPKYKIEHKAPLKIEMKPRYLRREKFQFVKKEFKIYDDVEDNDFTPLVKLAINELQNCFITGVAGAGKTTLIQAIKDELSSRDITYTTVATTNIASVNCGGITIDMFCNKLRSKKSIDNKVTDYVIIDEVSMMKEYFYKMLSVITRFKPDVKFIIVGDFEQFSVVKDRVSHQSDTYYSHSDCFHELVSSNIIKLTKCRRSDEKHFNNCQRFEEIQLSDYANSKDTSFHICYTNKKRCELNYLCMKKDKIRVEAENLAHKEHGHSLKRYSKYKILPKSEYSTISQNVYLCENTPIISITNKKDLDIVNGERFVISDMDEDFIYADNYKKTKKISIPIKKFQCWFHVSYAITCHKSQGMTINNYYTIHEWNHMGKKAKYVSLSRGTKYEYVNLV